MATSSLLWSSSSQEKGDEVPSVDPEPKEPSPIAKPKPRRGGKQSLPKKPPQRGLGVAQLERLRLQERWKKITEIDREIQPQPLQLPPIYDHQNIAPVAVARYGAPVAYVGSPAICYLPQCRVANPGFIGYGSVSAVRSVLPDQYSLDRVRIGTGSPFPELPSNQKTQCVSDQCEFCIRKKRLFGENLGFKGTNGADYFGMDLSAASMDIDEGTETVGYPERKGNFVREREIKEYEFFPHNTSTSDGGDSQFADRTVGVASSSAAASPNLLDLSLKLSG